MKNLLCFGSFHIFFLPAIMSKFVIMVKSLRTRVSFSSDLKGAQGQELMIATCLIGCIGGRSRSWSRPWLNLLFFCGVKDQNMGLSPNIRTDNDLQHIGKVTTFLELRSTKKIHTYCRIFVWLGIKLRR